MNSPVAKDIDRRLRKLERESVRLRKGVVTDDSPLSVQIGGSEVSFAGVSSVGPVADGDVVAVLSRDSGVMVLGTIGDGSASGGGAPTGPAGGDLGGTYPDPTVPGLPGKQPLAATLTALAALTTTAFGRNLLTLVDAAAARTNIGAAPTSHTHPQSDITGLVAALGGLQPLDADLTLIAALATTSYGRSLLTLANAAAARTSIDVVSTATHNSDIAAAKARANHTGTQTASTISNFDTQVHNSRLDQMAAPLADVPFNSKKITSLADGSSTADAVNYGQLSDGLALAVKSYSFKTPCKRVISTPLPTYSRSGDVLTATSNGYLVTDDGLPADTGERILVRGATNAAHNGIYVVNSFGGIFAPWVVTRTADATTGTLVSGSYTTVTSADEAQAAADYYLSTPDPIVVNTTSLTWTKVVTPLAPAAGIFRGYASSHAAVAAATDVVFAANAEDFDPDGWFDTSSSKGRYTPQKAGYYRFSGSIGFTTTLAAARYGILYLAKNGSRASQIGQTPAAAASAQMGGSDVLYMNGSTDYAELFIRHNHTAAISLVTGGTGCYFSGEFIGS